MNRSNFVIAFLTLALMPALLFAAAPVRLDTNTPQTFDDLYRMALKSNPTYRSSWEEQVLAKYTLYRAYGNFLPSVSTSARFSTTHATDNTASIGVRGSDYSSASSYGGSLSLPIWDGGARYGTLDNARLAVKAAPVILSQAEWQLSYNLHAALNSVVAAGELARAARSSVAVKQELLRLAEAKYNLGATPEIDVLSTRVQLNNAQTQLLSAVQDSALARVKLNQVIGIDPQSTFTVAELNDSKYELPTVESFVSEAKVRSPQGILADFEVKRAENEEQIARASWWPEIDLSQSFNWSNSAADKNTWSLAGDNKSQTTALSFNFPIFTGFARSQQRETAKVSRRQSTWNYQGKMTQLDQTVRDTYNRLVLAKQQIETAMANVDLAKRQRELEQERYRVGSSTLLLVQNALDAELNSQIQLINAQLNERTTRALLETTIGRSLSQK